MILLEELDVMGLRPIAVFCFEIPLRQPSRFLLRCPVRTVICFFDSCLWCLRGHPPAGFIWSGARCVAKMYRNKVWICVSLRRRLVLVQ
jgi:hypothetical protein